MFMDIITIKLCFSEIFPYVTSDFSWFQPIIGRFYKMRVFFLREFNIFLQPF